MKRRARSFAALSLVLLLSACGASQPETLSILAMDTAMTFSVYGNDADTVLSDASLEVRRLDALLSRTNPESAVTHLNAGDQLQVGEEVCGLLAAAQEYSAATGSAFDITLAPVSTAWGFTTDSYQVPSQEELDTLLAHVGMEHIHLTENTASLDPGTQIDLGAIAKGYASDQLGALFERSGVERGWVSLGGNVLAWGSRPDGDPWEVGIQDPAHPDDSSALVCSLFLEDAFAVTSGSYQRYFEQDGKRYHHILDPKTGAPAESGLVSVTVVADYAPGSGTMCDALSTALFVMGAEDALSFWRSGTYDFELVLVTEDGRVLVTEGLADQYAPAEGSTYVFETVS